MKKLLLYPWDCGSAESLPDARSLRSIVARYLPLRGFDTSKAREYMDVHPAVREMVEQVCGHIEAGKWVVLGTKNLKFLQAIAQLSIMASVLTFDKSAYLMKYDDINVAYGDGVHGDLSIYDEDPVYTLRKRLPGTGILVWSHIDHPIPAKLFGRTASLFVQRQQSGKGLLATVRMTNDDQFSDDGIASVKRRIAKSIGEAAYSILEGNSTFYFIESPDGISEEKTTIIRFK